MYLPVNVTCSADVGRPAPVRHCGRHSRVAAESCGGCQQLPSRTAADRARGGDAENSRVFEGARQVKELQPLKPI
jgi:hypothetical protein